MIVDAIGDVAEVSQKDFEDAPETMPLGIRRFVKGVYKMENHLISIIDLEKLSKEFSPSNESKENLNLN